MPFNVDDIEREQRPLSEKIYEYLVSYPRKAFTLLEITQALGDGPVYFTPHARSGGELIEFLLADIGLAALTAEHRKSKQDEYEVAILSLIWQGRVRAFEYMGQHCFAVAKSALPPAQGKALKAAGG